MFIFFKIKESNFSKKKNYSNSIYTVWAEHFVYKLLIVQYFRNGHSKNFAALGIEKPTRIFNYSFIAKIKLRTFLEKMYLTTRRPWFDQGVKPKKINILIHDYHKSVKIDFKRTDN